MAALPAHAVCAHGVAIVPEGRRVFPQMSVYDNLCLGAYRRGGPRRYRDDAGRGLRAVPAAGRAGTQLAGSLTGGEQQMLAIGRALMVTPRLLLLDEPSLGLAPVVVDEVFDAIVAINGQGVGVLLVEQDVERALRDRRPRRTC